MCALVSCWARPRVGGDPALSTASGVDAQLGDLLRGGTADTAGTTYSADTHWSLLSACRSDVVTVVSSERGAEKAREAAAEDTAAVRLQAAKRGQRARREVAGRRRQREGAQTFGSMTAVDESESSEEEDDDDFEEDDDDDFEEDDES